MVKNYGIHDEWKDLNKVNDIDIKSVNGVIDSIKVNGEEAGGGGDFKFVEIAISGTQRDFVFPLPVIFPGDDKLYVVPKPQNGTWQVPIYNNFLAVAIAGDWDASWFTTTGGVSFNDGEFDITGDGTITIS